ncbi:hypothetical protein [Streptomyces sp. HSG2]|uniref:hypothetical protein n=1 Tax=Streptomyces sp. HSG2 TaxID=2797167 RepID=UPI001903EF2C|nr:hypothetical protein [Streptomyces sp. HSG2]
MPGTVLLLAASPVGRGRLVDAASVLPLLAAVPPAVLSGTDTANVVELADPLDPQAVLTRLRAAAAAPGPLTVYVTGQLRLDRRQRLPHLELARTTAPTVRYTAVPWHWIREELRLRPQGTTTLLVDLHTDRETWDRLASRPLEFGPNHTVYGRVAPPPARRTVAVPAYMRAVAAILRSGHRPPPAVLHQQALVRLAEAGADASAGPAAASRPLLVARPAAGEDGVGSPGSPASDSPPCPPAGAGLPHARRVPALVADDRPPPPAPLDDPHAVISAAVRAGRHSEAAALAARHERAAERDHGEASAQALHWAEVRADLAMLAGDPALSCRVWLSVARVRLEAGEPEDAPAVEAAVDRAHHQWSRVDDRNHAWELGLLLADARGRVPGGRAGAVDHVRRELARLRAERTPA